MGRQRFRAGRRGVAVIYVVVASVAILGFCSLAVDVGRVHLVKAELRHTVDAAARFAAEGLAQSGPALARANAVACAHDNKADGTPVVLDPQQDVEFGTWDSATRSFAVVTGAGEAAATAVRVTARRTAARGNAVSLTFARAAGMNSFDATAAAVARTNSRKPGIVGLDFITMNGSAGGGNLSNSYRSSKGAFSAASSLHQRGTIASNGNITLTGSANVYGNAHPGPGKTVTTSGSASVSGSKTPLTKAMSYPAESAGVYATTNDNWRIPGAYMSEEGRDFSMGSSQTLTLPGGRYYLDDVTLSSSAILTFSGPATLYLTGNFIMESSVRASGDAPGNVRIVMVGTEGRVELRSSATLYADIYGPGSPFKMTSSAQLYGSVIAKSVTMDSSSKLYFDESLTIKSPGVTLVK